jgi:hypothetical protein
VVLSLLFAVSCDRCARRSAPHVEGNPSPGEAVRAEARAFYRDLAARDAPALLDHFWPAKIAARWEPPFDAAPARSPLLSAAIVPPARGATGRCATGNAAVARADVRIAGSWARALVPRCTGHDDELWFLEFDGRWKIVRLALGGEG